MDFERFIKLITATSQRKLSSVWGILRLKAKRKDFDSRSTEFSNFLWEVSCLDHSHARAAEFALEWIAELCRDSSISMNSDIWSPHSTCPILIDHLCMFPQSVLNFKRIRLLVSLRDSEFSWITHLQSEGCWEGILEPLVYEVLNDIIRKNGNILNALPHLLKSPSSYLNKFIQRAVKSSAECCTFVLKEIESSSVSRWHVHDLPALLVDLKSELPESKVICCLVGNLCKLSMCSMNIYWNLCSLKATLSEPKYADFVYMSISEILPSSLFEIEECVEIACDILETCLDMGLAVNARCAIFFCLKFGRIGLIDKIWSYSLPEDSEKCGIRLLELNFGSFSKLLNQIFRSQQKLYLLSSISSSLSSKLIFLEPDKLIDQQSVCLIWRLCHCDSSIQIEVMNLVTKNINILSIDFAHYFVEALILLLKRISDKDCIRAALNCLVTLFQVSDSGSKICLLFSSLVKESAFFGKICFRHLVDMTILNYPGCFSFYRECCAEKIISSSSKLDEDWQILISSSLLEIAESSNHDEPVLELTAVFLGNVPSLDFYSPIAISYCLKTLKSLCGVWQSRAIWNLLICDKFTNHCNNLIRASVLDFKGIFGNVKKESERWKRDRDNHLTDLYESAASLTSSTMVSSAALLSLSQFRGDDDTLMFGEDTCEPLLSSIDGCGKPFTELRMIKILSNLLIHDISKSRLASSSNARNLKKDEISEVIAKFDSLCFCTNKSVLALKSWLGLCFYEKANPETSKNVVASLKGMMESYLDYQKFSLHNSSFFEFFLQVTYSGLFWSMIFRKSLPLEREEDFNTCSGILLSDVKGQSITPALFSRHLEVYFGLCLHYSHRHNNSKFADSFYELFSLHYDSVIDPYSIYSTDDVISVFSIGLMSLLSFLSNPSEVIPAMFDKFIELLTFCRKEKRWFALGALSLVIGQVTTSQALYLSIEQREWLSKEFWSLPSNSIVEEYSSFISLAFSLYQYSEECIKRFEEKESKSIVDLVLLSSPSRRFDNESSVIKLIELWNSLDSSICQLLPYFKDFFVGLLSNRLESGDAISSCNTPFTLLGLSGINFLDPLNLFCKKMKEEDLPRVLKAIKLAFNNEQNPRTLRIYLFVLGIIGYFRFKSGSVDGGSVLKIEDLPENSKARWIYSNAFGIQARKDRSLLFVESLVDVADLDVDIYDYMKKGFDEDNENKQVVLLKYILSRIRIDVDGSLKVDINSEKLILMIVEKWVIGDNLNHLHPVMMSNLDKLLLICDKGSIRVKSLLLRKVIMTFDYDFIPEIKFGWKPLIDEIFSLLVTATSPITLEWLFLLCQLIRIICIGNSEALNHATLIVKELLGKVDNRMRIISIVALLNLELPGFFEALGTNDCFKFLLSIIESLCVKSEAEDELPAFVLLHFMPKDFVDSIFNRIDNRFILSNLVKSRICPHLLEIWEGDNFEESELSMLKTFVV